VPLFAEIGPVTDGFGTGGSVVVVAGGRVVVVGGTVVVDAGTVEVVDDGSAAVVVVESWRGAAPAGAANPATPRSVVASSTRHVPVRTIDRRVVVAPASGTASSDGS
jgi:hypothetical protein